MRANSLVLTFMIAFASAGPTLAAEPKFAVADVLNGLAWDSERCVGPGRLKVEVSGEPECIRFYGIAPSSTRGDPVVFFDGDVVEGKEKDANGQPVWSVPSFYSDLSPAIVQAEAERYAVSAERTFINLARPGTYGSTGNHLQRRREREVASVNAALDVLKDRLGWTTITLAGFSGGGHLVAALAARRSDIGCAIIASGNVAVRKRAEEFGQVTDLTGYKDFVDPIDYVSDVLRRRPRRVIMLTDPEDKVVSATSQAAYRDALRAVGVMVEQRTVIGDGPGRHDLREPAIIAGLTCALTSTR
jgi:dienelactone hydrolase